MPLQRLLPLRVMALMPPPVEAALPHVVGRDHELQLLDGVEADRLRFGRAARRAGFGDGEHVVVHRAVDLHVVVADCCGRRPRASTRPCPMRRWSRSSDRVRAMSWRLRDMVGSVSIASRTDVRCRLRRAVAIEDRGTSAVTVTVSVTVASCSLTGTSVLPERARLRRRDRVAEPGKAAVSWYGPPTRTLSSENRPSPLVVAS